ncbi:MAG: DUF5615 family PIN-like protein [Sphingomonadales bacterium]
MAQGGLKFFIDECLSPRMAERLGALGHDAIHPLHVGRRGERDDTVLRRCIDDDRIMVIENAADFRSLVSCEALHPGLIILPCTGRDRAWDLFNQALDFLAGYGEVGDVMVNHVLEIDEAGGMALFPLPA